MPAREQDDESLNKSLAWGLERMAQVGCPIKSPVAIKIDPSLRIMGYAKHQGDQHVIIVASWALDSEMLGGLTLHELAHIYHTERNSPSHKSDLIQEVISGMADREGLSATEIEVLTDAFNNLQNILVDDIVFAAMQSDREIKMIQRFFVDWVSDRPTGDNRQDAALVARNAFAIASLKRRGLYEPVEHTMSAKNQQFITLYNKEAARVFESIENFLEESPTNLSEEDFRAALQNYLEQILTLMRQGRKSWEDLR
ncbi:MAG: hypothetical protein HY619_03820 [Thaumarchaeota archaeon]|nr:hypothetical protein [Nitrososphaerota archaeon]